MTPGEGFGASPGGCGALSDRVHCDGSIETARHTTESTAVLFKQFIEYLRDTLWLIEHVIVVDGPFRIMQCPGG